METKAPIAVSFSGKGLSFRSKGNLFLDAEREIVSLVEWIEGTPKVLLTLSLRDAAPCESFDTLRDAPDELKFSLPFVAAEAFRLAYGHVDFRELASEEDD